MSYEVKGYKKKLKNGKIVEVKSHVKTGSKPRKGVEVRVPFSIRLEPSVKEKIVEVYGSLTKYLDSVIDSDEKLKE